jgi:hypothetical protein
MTDQDEIWSGLIEWLESCGLKRDELLVELYSDTGASRGDSNSLPQLAADPLFSRWTRPCSETGRTCKVQGYPQDVFFLFLLNSEISSPAG